MPALAKRITNPECPVSTALTAADKSAIAQREDGGFLSRSPDRGNFGTALNQLGMKRTKKDTHPPASLGRSQRPKSVTRQIYCGRSAMKHQRYDARSPRAPAFDLPACGLTTATVGQQGKYVEGCRVVDSWNLWRTVSFIGTFMRNA